MRVELHNHGGVVGEVTLSGGVAVPSNGLAGRTMDETQIVAGDPPALVRPEDGEAYLRAMARNLTGSYFWAVLVDA